jgi:hypothetical protein
LINSDLTPEPVACENQRDDEVAAVYYCASSGVDDPYTVENCKWIDVNKMLVNMLDHEGGLDGYSTAYYTTINQLNAVE